MVAIPKKSWPNSGYLRVLGTLRCWLTMVGMYHGFGDHTIVEGCSYMLTMQTRD